MTNIHRHTHARTHAACVATSHQCLSSAVMWRNDTHCTCITPQQKLLNKSAVQLPTSADSVALPTFVRCTPLLRLLLSACHAAIDRYRLPTCSNPPHVIAVVDRWDRQTDRLTPYRYVDPALHTMPAVPINGCSIKLCDPPLKRVIPSALEMNRSWYSARYKSVATLL